MKPQHFFSSGRFGFQDVPRCSKMFQDVPRCSKMFQDVPRCSKMFQVELFKNALEMLEINDHQLLWMMNLPGFGIMNWPYRETDHQLSPNCVSTILAHFQPHIPRCSMYGIFTYIWLIFGVNVGIHIPYMEHMGSCESNSERLMKFWRSRPG